MKVAKELNVSLDNPNNKAKSISEKIEVSTRTIERAFNSFEKRK